MFMPGKRIDGTAYYPGPKPPSWELTEPAVRTTLKIPAAQNEALHALVEGGHLPTISEGIRRALVPYLQAEQFVSNCSGLLPSSLPSSCGNKTVAKDEQTAKMATQKNPESVAADRGRNRSEDMMIQIQTITRYKHPKVVRFTVTMSDGQVVHTDAARLLSYQDFQVDVLEQTGEVFQYEWISEDNPWGNEVRRRMVNVEAE
jgi:hypothetical protein